MSVLQKVKSLAEHANRIVSRGHYHDDVSDNYLKVQRREIARSLPHAHKLESGYDFSW
jgi:hypothetical protein